MSAFSSPAIPTLASLGIEPGVSTRPISGGRTMMIEDLLAEINWAPTTPAADRSGCGTCPMAAPRPRYL